MYAILNAFIRYPVTCLIGFIMLMTMLAAPCWGCEKPDNGSYPDGQCPTYDEWEYHGMSD